MHNINNIARIFVIATILVAAQYSHSLPTDFQQEAIIDADNTKADINKGITVLSGNVFYQQGSLKIKSDILTMLTNAEQKIESFVASGTPTTFEQQLDVDQEPVKASGEKFEISYVGPEQILTISGDAFLQHLNSRVTCDKIIYNLTTGDFEFDKNNSDIQCRMNLIPPAEETATADQRPAN